MIAFKTFAQCPEDKRPAGIPLEWPWQEQSCTLEAAEAFEAEGFQVVTDEEYLDYKLAYDVEYNAWQLANRKIPKTILPRQVRLAMIGAGISLSSIDSFIQSLPEPTKSAAYIWWEYSLEFQRDNALLNSLAPQLGLSQTDLDNLFIAGGSL